MTDLSPNNPYNTLVPTVPMQWFPGRVRPYNNIQPFTYTDGETYLDVQTALREWLSDQLVPFVNSTFEEYILEFNKALAQLSQFAQEFQDYIAAEKSSFDSAAEEYRQLVEKSTTDFINLSTEAMDAVKADADRAESARDLAEQYAAQAGIKADATIAAFLNDPASVSAQAANNVIATNESVVNKKNVRVAVQHRIWTTGSGQRVRYARAVSSCGFLPLSAGHVDKRYANDFDVTNPNATGTAFKPPGAFLHDYAFGMSGDIVANASGWNVTNNEGEMRGAQIRNGNIQHDFEATNLAGSPAGVEGIGIDKNGRMKCYSALRGDTAASMVAAGVVHAWSYGPNLIVDGVAQDLTTKNWQYFLTEISARTIIGQRANGDIVIIVTVGKTNVQGITGNDMVLLAQREELYNASTFDGGGSSQLFVHGYYNIPSSDDWDGYDKTFGRRKVGDCFILRGDIVTKAVDTGWVDIPLRDGYTAYGTGQGQKPQVRTVDGVTELRGGIKPTNGNFGSDDVVIGDIPQSFGHDTAAKAFVQPGNGSNTRKVAVQSNRSITIVGSDNTPTYIVLDGISWGTVTF